MLPACHTKGCCNFSQKLKWFLISVCQVFRLPVSSDDKIDTIVFADSGGAIYLECINVDPYCALIMNRSVGLLSSLPSTKALELINNLAYGYGNDIATSPYEIVSTAGTNLSLSPMIDPVNVSWLLRDSFGQIIKGTADFQTSYVMESWTCLFSDCKMQQSLSPVAFHSFDAESGIVDILASNFMTPCAINHPTVIIHFSLYGSTSSLLTKTSTVFCRPCGSSQVRIHDMSPNKFPIWFCRPCLSGQYIINPNEDSCQDCPAGDLSVRFCTLQKAKYDDVVLDFPI
jgi:hypothetical protein